MPCVGADNPVKKRHLFRRVERWYRSLLASGTRSPKKDVTANETIEMSVGLSLSAAKRKRPDRAARNRLE